MSPRDQPQSVRDLAAIVSERNDIKADEAERFVTQMFGVVREALGNDEQVKVRGLGTFKVTAVRERASVSVNTGERVIIDAHTRISFTPDVTMRDSVNKPFSHFETVPLNDGVAFDDLNASETEPSPAALPPATSPIVRVVSQEPQEAAQPSATDTATTVLSERTVVCATTQQPVAAVSDREQSDSIKTPEIETTTTEHMSKDNDSLDDSVQTESHSTTSTSVALFLALVTLIVGVLIGRATADITYADVRHLFIDDKPPVRVHVVYKTLTAPPPVAAKAPATEKKAPSKESMDVKGAMAVPAGQRPTLSTSATYDERKAAPANPAKAAPVKAAETATHSTATSPAASDPYARYNSDSRLRFGAYRIVGVAQTVTVAPGQTLASISKAHLGPGMECYMQVLNQTSEVKAGQRVRIPQLKTKKSLSKKR